MHIRLIQEYWLSVFIEQTELHIVQISCGEICFRLTKNSVFVFAIWPIFLLSLFYYLSVIADMAWNYVFSFPFKSCLACTRNFCCFGVLWKRDLHLDADFYQIESKSQIFEVIFNYRELYFHTKICYFYTKVFFKKHTSKFGVEISLP